MKIDVDRLSAVLPAAELVEVLKNEIERLRLTDEERDAIAWARFAGHLGIEHNETLRGLLERTK